MPEQSISPSVKRNGRNWRFQDLTGKTFGQLTVLQCDSVPGAKTTRWKCICSCGNIKSVSAGELKSGGTKSCGCRKLLLATKHGLYKTAEYAIWHTMKARCLNPKDQGYKGYGGRGIGIHEPWVNDFMAFYNYVGPRPTPLHSIDRINNNGNYEPGNVRWATRKEQSRNKSHTRLITFDGETMCLTDWAQRLGMAQGTLVFRLRHWPIQRAFTQPRHRVGQNYYKQEPKS
jgi:hypothetical protein